VISDKENEQTHQNQQDQGRDKDANVRSQVDMLELCLGGSLVLKFSYSDIRGGSKCREDDSCEDADNTDEGVEDEQEEELSVFKTDAVVDPRAVMIHIQDTSVADGAMVASFRFEYMADETISPFLDFCVIQVEALAVKRFEFLLPSAMGPCQGL
jgi:hypothetical protein